MVKYLINKQYDVDDAEANATFGKGEKREDYADAWQNTGTVVLVGLPGSGKAGLAALLAERTGLDVANPASADEAVAVLGGEKKIVILTDFLVEDPVVQPLIHGAGKVFYLMGDSRTLSDRVAERDAVADPEQLWRDMSARLAVMEPIFYSVLHFILPAGRTPEELVEDALEKVSF